MPEGESKFSDVLGIKPVAEVVNKATSALIDGASAILSRICLPAAEELGLHLRDKVSAWRASNLISVAKRLEKKLAETNVPEGANAHPRIVHSIMDQGSWIEDGAIQDMWAGLLSSSCTESGDDDSNLIFVNLLGNLTRLQARVLKYACEQASKAVGPAGLIHAGDLYVSVADLMQMTEENDVHRLDRELDCLRSAGLLEGGMNPVHGPAVLTPSTLALHMYVRCQGSRASPIEFFKLSAPPSAPPSTSSPVPQSAPPPQA